jgi:LysR family transcriptional regulator, cell division regulator
MLISAIELNYFIEVANTLNFSRAAERLGITQPTLSMAMRRLEEALEIKLFIRLKRGVILTQGGVQLLSHTKQLLQYWHEVKSKTMASHHETQGSFVIGCHTTVALHCLSKCLPSLLEQYPKLEINLEHDISRKITERVISLAIDVGIVVNPIRHLDLIIRKLCDDEITLWKAKGKRKIQQFNSGQTTIICDPQLSQTQDILKKCNKLGLYYTRIMPTSSLEAVASFTASGCGIGILPARLATMLYPKVLSKIPNVPVYHDEICMLYRVENKNIKAIQVIADSIKNYFNK